MIKLLDLTNPKHQKIVAEEIARAKRILKEAASDRFLQSAARNLAAQMQGKAASETTLMNRLNRMPLANRLAKSDLDKIVDYAMKEMGLAVAVDAGKLDYAKIVKWIESNQSMLSGYEYESGGLSDDRSSQKYTTSRRCCRNSMLLHAISTLRPTRRF